MNIETAFQRVDALTTVEAQHMLQLCDDSITRYQHVFRNYSPYRMQKLGQPFLNRLLGMRAVFQARLEKLTSENGW